MKKTFKIILLLMFLVILQGCTAKESILIENTGYTDETMNYYANNEFYYFQEDSITDYINNQLSPFVEELENNDFNYNVYSDISNSGVEINKTYDNVCDYFENSPFIKKLYNTIECTETDSYYEIISNSNLLSGGSDFDNYVLDKFDDVTFTLETGLIIEKSNADEIKNNIYRWDFSNKNLDKIFHIKVKKSNLIDKNASSSYVKNIKQKSRMPYVIIAIIIVIISLIFYILYRKHKSKKIEC